MMDDVWNNIPNLLLYVIPGFCGVCVFRKLTHQKVKEDLLWVESIGCSYLSCALIQWVAVSCLMDIRNNTLCLLSTGLCLIVSVLLAKLFRWPRFRSALRKQFSLSMLEGVFANAIDWVNGSEVYLKLRNTGEMWCGSADTVSKPTDPAQWICIMHPQKINEDFERLWPENEGGTDGNRMVFRLEDVEYIRFV